MVVRRCSCAKDTPEVLLSSLVNLRCCGALCVHSWELPEKDLSWRHNQPLCSDLRPGPQTVDINIIIVMLLVRIVVIIVNNIITIIIIIIIIIILIMIMIISIMRSLIMTSISVTIIIIIISTCGA